MIIASLGTREAEKAHDLPVHDQQDGRARAKAESVHCRVLPLFSTAMHYGLVQH